MNQKGWTNYGDFTSASRVQDKIDMGAKYLFISDKRTYQKSFLEPFLRNQIGSFKNIDIYKL